MWNIFKRPGGETAAVLVPVDAAVARVPGPAAPAASAAGPT